MKRIISIDDIRGAAAPIEVELSGWNPDEIFVVKLRKPGLFQMQMDGGIPNPVLAIIPELFAGRQLKGAGDPETEKNAAEAFRHIARMSLVEPTLEEIEDAGALLTDNQYLEIYSFVLGGAEAVARFRATLRSRAGSDGEAVQREAVGADGADGPSGDVDGGRGDTGDQPEA